MKILVVNTVDFGRNGISSVIMNYYNEIKNQKGLLFDFLSISEVDEEFKKQIERYSKIFIIKNRKRNPIKYGFNLYKLLKCSNYDIIHVHGNSSLLSLELFVAKLLNVPVRIAHSHNTTCDHKILNRILQPIFFSCYTHGIACSEEAGKWMFSNHKFMILENGIDTKKYEFNNMKRQELREQLNIDNRIVIGHIGGFVPQKNHTLLISKFYEVLKQNNNFHLILIGDGPLKKNIEQMCIDLKIKEYVTFLGNIKNTYDYYNMMDIFFMPSLYEGLPVVLVEAQANGLHCVVSDAIAKESNLTDLLKFCNEKQYVRSLEIMSATDAITDITVRKSNSYEAKQKLSKMGFDVKVNSDKLIDFYNSSLHVKNFY